MVLPGFGDSIKGAYGQKAKPWPSGLAGWYPAAGGPMKDGSREDLRAARGLQALFRWRLFTHK